MSNIQVNFGHILPETSKSSAFWDRGVDSHLKWLLLFSPNELDGTSLLENNATINAIHILYHKTGQVPSPPHTILIIYVYAVQVNL